MRARRMIAAVATAAVLGTVYVGGVFAQEGGGRGRVPLRILGEAPTDRAVSIPKTQLEQHFKDMDGAGEGTLRMIEGGHYNVNIRRIKRPEARPLIHPKTIDLWYVLEGSGAVTTGGTFADGKVTGGVKDQLQPGDVIFIPANLPHWLSDTGPEGITWLNVRWDVDWNGPMGAGTLPQPGVTPRFVVPVGEYATPDKAIFLSKAKIENYIAEQNAKPNASQTTRMIEGGHFNVNIRNITQPSAEHHPTTIDTWIVLQGAGTAAMGFDSDKGDAHTPTGRDAKIVPNTGVATPMAVGDVMFVPSNFTHGFSAVDGRVVWLNIRWDSNY